MNDVEEYWSSFLERHNLPLDTKYRTCFHFGMNERLANELLDLVLKGKKRATFSSIPSFELGFEEQPRVNDLHIVTDYAGNPCCVFKTTHTRVLPFEEVTWDLAKCEGEDEHFQSWRE